MTKESDYTNYPWYGFRSSVKTLIVGEGITSIADEAFLNGYITTLTLGNTVEEIGIDSFRGCDFASVTLPNSVSKVGAGAFYQTYLAELNIGTGLTEFGENAFTNNTLTTISVAAANTCFASVDGVLYTKDMGKMLLYPASKTGDTYTIPDGVTEIASTISNNNIKTLNINKDLEILCERPFDIWVNPTITIVPANTHFKIVDDYILTFDGKQLIMHIGRLPADTATIPAGVEEIASYAFYDQTNVTGFALPGSLTTIGDYAFYSCDNLDSVAGGSAVTYYGKNAFKNCEKLQSFKFGDSISFIGENAFENSKLINIILNGAEDAVIGKDAFYNSKYVESISISGGFSIGLHAFGSCGISNGEAKVVLTLGEGIRDIGDTAFSSADIAEVTIPDSVTAIGSSAFAYIGTLKSVTIGTGVKSIGQGAFSACSIDSLTFNAVSCADLNQYTFDFDTESTVTVTFGSSVQRIPAYLLYFNAETTCIKSLTIPNSVTEIGNYAFKNCAGVTELTLSANVTNIGSEAFSYCAGIESLALPASLSKLGSRAFYHCTGLTSLTYNAVNCQAGSNTRIFDGAGSEEGMAVTFGETVEIIPEELFAYSNIGPEVTLPHGVTTVGQKAFTGCNKILTVTIPDSVTSFGYYPFLNCTSVKTINYNAVSIESVPNNYDPFRNAGSEDPGITINIGASVVIIPECFVSGNANVKAVNMGANVETIGASAFSGTGITSIEIPTKVTSIGSYAFSSCNSLAEIRFNAIHCGDFNSSPFYCMGEASQCEVVIGDSVEHIPNCLFRSNDKVISVTMGSNVVSIGSSAFASCAGLTSVTLPASVKSVGNYAFYTCTGLTSITYGAVECTSYGNSVFYNSGAETGINLIVSEGVTSIPGSAFYYVGKIKSVSLPSTLITIGKDSFAGTSITALEIPDHVTTIGSTAFSDTHIESLTIGKSVSSIDSGAFYNSSKLTAVVYNAVNVTSASSLFNDGAEYEDFTLTIGTEVKSIPAKMFQRITRLTGALVLPDSVLSVGANAFDGCTGLSSIEFGDNLQNIGQEAFKGCSGLTDIFFGTNDLIISNSAFKDCSGVSALTVPSNVTSIGAAAFSGMTSLVQINFNANCEITGNGAIFNAAAPNCVVTFGEGVTTVPTMLFYGCANLKTVNYNDDIETIGRYAFNSTGITVITLPDSVRTIDQYAFVDCSYVTEITIPSAVESVDSTSFNGFSFFDLNGDRLSHNAGKLAGYKFTGTPQRMEKCDTGFSFETNGGSAIGDLIGIEGKAVPSVDEPTKSHYTFGGWYSDESLSTPYTIAKFPGTHITLYAQWTPGTTAITIDVNEGAGENRSTTATYDAGIEAFDAVTRTGYDLDGYYTEPGRGVRVINADGSLADAQGYVVDGKWVNESASLTLYAQWNVKSTILFIRGNGIDTTIQTNINYDQTAGSFTTPFTRTGYDLTGFWTAAENGVKIMNADKTLVQNADGYIVNGKWALVEGRVDLYCQWTPGTTAITLNANGGASNGSATATYDGGITDFNTVARTGYELTGFFTAAENGVLIINANGSLVQNAEGYVSNGKWISETAECTLYAQWSAKTYRIVIDKGEGTENGYVDVTYDSGVTEFRAPVRVGYSSTGYYDDQDTEVVRHNGSLVSAETVYTTNGKWTYDVISDLTFYPNWLAERTVVTLDRNGGDSDRTFTAEYDAVLPSFAVMTRTGYDLTGYWTSASDGTMVINTDGTLVRNTAYADAEGRWIHIGSELVLYAQWNAKTTAITIDKNTGESGGQATATYGLATIEIAVIPVKETYFISGYAPTADGDPIAEAGGRLRANTAYTDADGKWTCMDETLTLYTIWTNLIVDVTLEGVEGTDGTARAVFGGYLTDVTAPARTGYEVEGYYTDSARTQKVVDGNGDLIAGISGYTDANGKWIKEENFTLYTKWNAKTTAITIDANGGSANRNATATYDGGITSFDAVTRIGYILDGYFTASDSGDKVINPDGTMVNAAGYVVDSKWANESATLTLYARWTAKTTEIAVDRNGGDADKGTSATYDGAIISFDPISRTGYTLSGYWSAAQGGVKIVNADGSTVLNAEGYLVGGLWKLDQPAVTIYAQWTANTTDITIDKNGGDSNRNATATYDAGITDFDAVTRAGYDLAGYSTQATGGVVIIIADGTLVQNADGYVVDGKWASEAATLTLYAQWVAKDYDLTLQKNGGASDGSASVTYDSNVLLVVHVSRTGYDLTGYYTAASGGAKIIGTDGALVASIPGYTDADGKWVRDGAPDLYAQWQIHEYAITYHNTEGATNNNPATYNVETGVNFAYASKDYYTPAGWFAEAGLVTKVTGIAPGETGDKDVYAKWTPVDYSISYVLNGGTNAANPTVYNIESATITLQDAVREDYRFTGWFRDVGLETPVTTIATGSHGNVTVYAGWEAIMYTVTADPVGGTLVNPAGWTLSSGVYTKEFASSTAVSDIIGGLGNAQKDAVGSTTYTFKSWTGYESTAPLKADLTVTAVYESVIAVPDPVSGTTTVDSATETAATITTADIDKVKNDAQAGTLEKLDINMKNGSISLDSASIQSLSTTDDLEVSIKKDEGIPNIIVESAAGRSVYDIKIGDVHQFDGKLTITLDYQLGPNENPNNLVIWNIKEDGTHEALKCTYADGKVTFETTHLSYYAVMVESPAPNGGGNNTMIIVGVVIAIAAVLGIFGYLIMTGKLQLGALGKKQ
ncbi:MAG: leucine-rich repeat protein [Candidatus Methanomethylophilus sp.]|nr:leucine-rich repeat protein [Methanomethylophilus sp.]